MSNPDLLYNDKVSFVTVGAAPSRPHQQPCCDIHETLSSNITFRWTILRPRPECPHRAELSGGGGPLLHLPAGRPARVQARPRRGEAGRQRGGVRRPQWAAHPREVRGLAGVSVQCSPPSVIRRIQKLITTLATVATIDLSQ